MPSWKDEARDRVKTQKEGATFKLAEGENMFRILPNKKGPKFSPFIEFRTHRDVGPDKRFVACGKDIQGNGECWLCDKKIPELDASESSKKRLMAEQLTAKEQFVVQVSRINEDGKWTMPKFWWVSTGSGLPGKHPRSLSVSIQSLLASSRVDYEDPVKGRNMSIARTGSGLQTKYDPVITDETSSKVPAAVLAKLAPLEDVVPEYSARKQYNAYMGKEDDAEEPVSRPRHRNPDPVEEEEETPVDEETEEEPVEEETEELEDETEEPAEDPDTPEEPAEEEEPLEEDIPEPEPPPRRASVTTKKAPAKAATKKAAVPAKTAPKGRRSALPPEDNDGF